MALMSCPECGKEVSDTAKKCPHCGYALNSVIKSITNNKKKITILCGIGLAVVLLIFVVSILIRPNIKMDDFDTNNNAFETLLFLGIPTEINGDEWEYDECGVKFYNIPVTSVSYDISEGKYHLFFFGNEYQDNIKDVLSDYCDYSDSVYIFSDYTYKELNISFSYDSDYCSIFID